MLSKFGVLNEPTAHFFASACFNISFNVSIPKDNSDIQIDVLDEAFCQPYDYQYMLDKNPEFEPALVVKEQVEDWMKYLQDNEVISGHVYGEYI